MVILSSLFEALENLGEFALERVLVFKRGVILDISVGGFVPLVWDDFLGVNFDSLKKREISGVSLGSSLDR